MPERKNNQKSIQRFCPQWLKISFRYIVAVALIVGVIYYLLEFTPIGYVVIDRSYRKIADVLFPDNSRLREYFRLFSWLWTFVVSLIYAIYALLSLRSNRKSQKRLKQIPKELNIEELAIDELREIRDYYILSKKHTSQSFVLTLLMSTFGFFMVGVTIFCAVYSTGDLVITLIPATGAVVVEVIAGTALLAYKKSLDQLNHCYNALIQNQRFLLAIKVASNLPENERNKLYRDIIMQHMKSDVMGCKSSEEPNQEKKKVRIRKKTQE